jgi:TatD DNase family protein
MLIDIHRHSNNYDTAGMVIRNLYHSQTSEIEEKRLYTVGLHPWYIKIETLRDDLEKVKNSANHPQVIAIGETGLDKNIDVPLSVQNKAFEEQIKIAKEAGKPMIIHCVRTYNEISTLKQKTKHKSPWIIHWFNASAEMGKQLIDQDFYLSFGHMLFNEQSKGYKSFCKLPLERIFLETDDTGYTIDEVYRQAVKLLEIPLETLESQIANNFKSCFGIKI